jgi:diguanylate cyclase (GGDEF)-like protein/PAS domain S-box-containing protein
MDEPKVLIVEDSVEMADLLAISLQDDDIETEWAASGEEALKKLRAGRIDLVLLDLGLPDMDGLELLSRIRRDKAVSQVPVIVITGREKMSDKVKAFDLGAVDYINKPINFLDVQARIVATLSRHRQQAEEETEARQQQQRTTQELLRISTAVDSASDAVMIQDENNRCVYVNAAFETLFDLGVEDLQVGGRLRRLFADSKAADDIWETCEEHGSWSGEVEMNTADEASVRVHARGDAILDERRQFLGAVLILTDIRQRKRLEEDLLFLANHDALTGLHNRRYFVECLKTAADDARNGKSSFLMHVDMDHFKVINYQVSHKGGDRLLIQLAQLLKEERREGDELARVGGDEFAWLLPDVDAAEAEAFARRLAAKLSSTRFREGADEYCFTASIGLTPMDGETASEDVLARAVSASYRIKSDGGNGTDVFSSEEESLPQLSQEFRSFMRVKSALEENRLEVWLQPIVPLNSEQPTYFEALVRMRGLNGDIIGPDDFLPAAEKFGILHQVDHFVLYRCIELLREHDELRLSVNLSARTLTSVKLPELIRGLLGASGIDPHRLLLEITETTMIRNMDRARENVRSLQEIGCSFALDDFGSGVSSLVYLRDLPVDVLKIDGSFIQTVHESDVNREIVRAVTSVSRIMQRKTVAEYVCDAKVLAAVRELDVDYVQGWHIYKPAPPEEFAKIGWKNVTLPAE